MKLPKLRGYNNNPLKKKPLAVNVGDLHKIEGGVVNLDSLKKSGLIKSTRKATVKILGKGELKKALKIENLPVSKEAQVKIEKAGGEITVAKK
jgi:large subunit ribosomal protein L15